MAFESGLLTDIIPVTVDGKTLNTDNGVRIVPPEKMAKLKPVFRPEIGTVTGGNSSFFYRWCHGLFNWRRILCEREWIKLPKLSKGLGICCSRSKRRIATRSSL